ncbi:Calcineurin-like phosphoesterase [Nonomuraea maritima]|uniref:Calcineurin-like phosphoesterase n=1 Tax=Nonomuraea maritima TaxID=683260 RepID=A0A1G9BTQ4_9ACTN|nr:metallophosphoesterase [Nonomuraea maritima]SDK42838.1 Calcineurin-like phosphoesterase [Nonomuraea maritima]
MRIAHITDIHLRSHISGHPALPVRRGRTAPELLAAALDDARRRGADAIVITGDLVDVPGYLFDPEPDAARDTRAWQRVRADHRLVRRMLDDCGIAWIAVPGNHDSYRVHAEELGSGPFVRDVGELRFVSFWDRESTGNVPRRTLTERERFDSSLLDPGPRPQVHLQHFVITPRLDEGYPHTYAEGEELQRRLSDSGRVVLFLSGHRAILGRHARLPCRRRPRPRGGRGDRRSRTSDAEQPDVSPPAQRPCAASRRGVR